MSFKNKNWQQFEFKPRVFVPYALYSYFLSFIGDMLIGQQWPKVRNMKENG